VTLKVRTVKIEDLVFDPANANRNTKKGRAMLAKSLERYGAGRSILIDKHNVVIAGNSTLAAAKAAGLTEIEVIESDGTSLAAVQRGDLDLSTDKKARELAIADNRASELGLDWDPEVLSKSDADLSQFWSENELRKVLGEFAPAHAEAPEPRFDKAAALQKKWKTARGQLWVVGDHRLMCGDSGNADDVAKLFGKKKAWLLQTDPPYGVGYGVESGPDSAKRFSPITSDGNDGPKLQAFLEKVFSVALPYLEPGASWYLWHAQMTQGFFSAAAAAAAAAASVKIHRQVVWAKSHFILGHGDYHWQHELCFYGWREGEKHRWFGDRSQTTVWHIDNPRIHENHPTEKPVEIFARPMMLNTQAGDICYEPFSGSGSQFCAGQIRNRPVFGLEIDPGYTAVALERLAEMGLEPALLNK
jgi:site-specific DNA-methyltransferase (adenine-specific)